MIAGLREIVDYGTVGTAAGIPTFRLVRYWLKSAGWPTPVDLFADSLRGAAFFPCVLLAPAAFYPDLMTILLGTKREFVVLSGIYAAVAVWFSDTWMRNVARGALKSVGGKKKRRSRR
jgi:hypothetical protein